MRFVRKLFTLLSALSFCLCLATLGLWLEASLGGSSGNRICAPDGKEWLWFYSRRGQLEFHWLARNGPRIRGPVAADASAHWAWMRQFPPTVQFDWHDFHFSHGPGWTTEKDGATWMEGDRVWITIPHWPVALVLALPPACWYLLKRWRWRARRAARRWYCVHCGYDLRAASGFCPECGTPIPAGVVKMPAA